MQANVSVKQKLCTASDPKDPLARLDPKDLRVPPHKAGKARPVRLVFQAQRDRAEARREPLALPDPQDKLDQQVLRE